MDAVDAKILRMLYWSPFNPLDVEKGPYGIWDIARELGVHGNTVKRRLADLESAGVLNGLSLFPNSSLVGVNVGFYALHFPDDATCAEAASKLFDDPFPGATMRFTTPEIRLNIPVPAPGDPDEAARGLGKELGAERVELIMNRYWESEPLTDLEFRVLNELHKDLFATPPDIAARVGVTPKTVRRCIQVLRDKKTFCVVPLVDPMAITGMQAIILDVDVGDDAAAANQLCRTFPDLLPNGVYTAQRLNFIALGQTPRDIGGMLQEIRSIPGVKDAVAHMALDVRWQALPEGLDKVSHRMGKIKRVLA